jgi:hypothetical protein
MAGVELKPLPPADALEHFRAAVRIDRDLGYIEGLIYGLVGIAAALPDEGEAAALLAAADAAARASAVEREPLELELHRALTARLRHARPAGPPLSLDEAVERGLKPPVSAP